MHLEPAKAGKRGHTLLELLLVIVLSGIITAACGYMLQALLARHRANSASTAETRRYHLLVTSLQFAYEQRCQDPFSNEPWMRIETAEGDNWFPLKELELTVVENNNRVKWQWDAPGLVDVMTNIPTRAFSGHERPHSLRFKFPGSSLPVLREGIAIEGIPETILLKE